MGILVPEHGGLDLFFTRRVAVLLDGLIDHILAEFAALGRVHVEIGILLEGGLSVAESHALLARIVNGGYLALVGTALDLLGATKHWMFLARKERRKSFCFLLFVVVE